MRRFGIFLTLFVLNACGILVGQQRGADPAQRYFRLICLVHLTGSGQAGDPVVPEYVVQGTAVAQAAVLAATNAAAANPRSNSGNTPPTPPATAGSAVRQRQATAGTSDGPGPTAPVAMASRPGYLAWSMQKSDDGTMAIIHIVAADHHAFDSILADKRPEIRVFEIGKDSPDAIQAEMQKYKKDFNLNTFQVVVR